MNRLDKIKQTYHDKLECYIKNNGMDICVNNMFDTIVCKDPSQDKRYTRWLIETLLNDGYLFEDLSTNLHYDGNITVGEDLRVNLHCKNNEFDSKVTETLRVFMKNSRKLNPVDRSINRYQSIADIWKMVKEYAEDKTGHQVKREEYDKAMSESEIVIDNDDIRIVVPLTEYASKFYGRGTRWCTGADNNNMFWDYAKNAPLFIIMLKGSDDKLQLWRNNDNIQFMDEDNKEINYNDIQKIFDKFPSVISVFMSFLKWLSDLEYIPLDYRDNDVYMRAVSYKNWQIKYIPGDQITYDICFQAIKQGNGCLNDIPKKYLYLASYPELCELIISNAHCHGLKHIIFDGCDKKTIQDFYERAIKYDDRAIKYVKSRYITTSLCLNIDKSFQHIPRRIKTISFFKKILLKKPQLIGDIIRCIQDIYEDYDIKYIPELCYIAVTNGAHLHDIPEKYKTLELCKMAIANGDDLSLIPKKHLSDDLIREAWNRNVNNIRYMPIEYLTSDLLRKSIDRDKNNCVIQYVLRHHEWWRKEFVIELCERAFDLNVKSFQFNMVDAMSSKPEKLNEMICKSIKYNSWIFFLKIPCKMITKEMMDMFLENHPGAISSCRDVQDAALNLGYTLDELLKNIIQQPKWKEPITELKKNIVNMT